MSKLSWDYCFLTGGRGCVYEKDGALAPQASWFYLAAPREPAATAKKRAEAVDRALRNVYGVGKYKLLQLDQDYEPGALHPCHGCEEMRKTCYAIVDISGRNPNTMIQLGMFYGMRTPVILLAKEGEAIPAEVKSALSITYSDFLDLLTGLENGLPELPKPAVVDDAPLPSEIVSRPPASPEAIVPAPSPVRDAAPVVAPEPRAPAAAAAPSPPVVQVAAPVVIAAPSVADQFLEAAKAAGLPARVAIGAMPEVPPDRQAEMDRLLPDLEKDPRSEGALAAGSYLFALERWDDARRSFQRAVRLDAGSIAGWYGLGVSLTLLGDFEEARAAFLRVVEAEKNDVGALCGLGNASRELGDLPKAAESYRRAVELAPGEARARRGLGLVLQQQRQYMRSIEEYQAALKLEPDDVVSLTNMGFVYRDIKEPGKAMDAFQEALKRARNYPEAHRGLGLVYLRLKFVDKAADAFRKALEADPENPWCHLHTAEIHLARKDLPKAGAVLAERAALWTDPALRLASACLRAAHAALSGKPDALRVPMREALTIFQDRPVDFAPPWDLTDLLPVLEKGVSGDPKAALSDLAKVLKLQLKPDEFQSRWKALL